MSDTSVVFVDRLLNVAATGPLVRLQWGVMGFPQAEGEKPAFAGHPDAGAATEGLLTSMGMIEGLVKQLVKDGMLKPEALDNPSTKPLQ